MIERHSQRDVTLLVRLTEWLQLPGDRASARRHLDSSRREGPSSDSPALDSSTSFDLACQRAGMRITKTDSSRLVATPQTPVVVRTHRTDGGGWAIVVDRRRASLKVVTHLQEEARWISSEQLLEELGIGADDEADWTLVHSAAPCDSASSSQLDGDQTKPLARLLAILRPDRSDLWAVAIFAVAIGALLLATPVAVQALVNFVAFGGAVAPVIVLALMLAVGLGFAAGLGAMQTWIVEVLQRRIFVRMVSDLANRLPRVHRETHYRSYGPELVNRFFDVITIQKMSSLLLLDGLGVLLGVVIGLVVLAFYHPLLLAFDLLIIVSVAIIVFVLGRSGVRTAIRESKSKYAVASWLEDIARNPVTFKAPSARRFVLQRSDELALEYVQARRSHYRVLFRQIIGMLVLQAAASVVLLGIGGMLVIRGELTLGQLVASELIVTYVVGSIAKMGKHFESYYDLMAAVDKLGNLLDLRLERGNGEAWSDAVALNPAGAAIQLSSVKVKTPAGRAVLDDFSIRIDSGDRIAITGPSGRGKSTLLEMLYGLVDPDSGLVELDGLDLKGVRLEALRERVSLVQQPEIFEATILDNVLLGRSISTEAVHDALRRVGLLEACAALPDGVLTQLTSKGGPLSEGQIHRLMLARAIVGSPRLLLVDALLDVMSAAALEELMRVLTEEEAPWTLIIVSNRSEVLGRCNRVIDLSPNSELLLRGEV